MDENQFIDWQMTIYAMVCAKEEEMNRSDDISGKSEGYNQRRI